MRSFKKLAALFMLLSFIFATVSPAMAAAKIEDGKKDDGSASKGIIVYDDSLTSNKPKASGEHAVAMGTGTTSNASYAFAMGSQSKAMGVGSVAMGQNAQAYLSGAVAIGSGTNASGQGSTALGAGTKASGDYSIAMNCLSNAVGNYSTSMGYVSNATGMGSFAGGGYYNSSTDKAFGGTAYGRSSFAFGEGAVAGVDGDTTDGGQIALGNGAQATAANTVALGNGSTATGAQSIAIGTGNTVSGTGSGAFGDPNTVTGNNSYAIGNNNTIAQDGTFVLGSSVTTTQANTVVLGSGSADKAGAAVTSATINGTTYNFKSGTAGSAANGVVSVGSATSPRQIVNVANGSIVSGSLDAVNGGQIFDIISNLPSGGGAWTAKVGTTDLAVNSSNPLEFVAGDGIELSADNTSGNKITIKASGGGGEDANAVHYNADKSEVALKGTEGTAISNVKAAELAEGGTYAATTGQLYKTNQAIAAESMRAQTVERHLQSEINANTQEIREVGAISAALAGLHFAEPSGEAGDKLVGAVAYGGYRGSNAEAIGLAYKPSPNMMLSASTSISNGNDSQNAYNVGFSLKFGKGETAKTKAELQKQVKYLNDKNSVLESTVAQQGTEIQTLKNELEELKKLIKK